MRIQMYMYVLRENASMHFTFQTIFEYIIDIAKVYGDDLQSVPTYKDIFYP